MSELINHAKREFEALGWPGDDGMQALMCNQVLELLDVFSGHEHSGFSAPYAIRMFEKLARFEPLGPLTGADSEWNEIGADTWQNNRCSHVFKGADGKAYDIEAVIFREPDGICFTSGDSHRFIEFPYTPKREYVDVPASA